MPDKQIILRLEVLQPGSAFHCEYKVSCELYAGEAAAALAACCGRWAESFKETEAAKAGPAGNKRRC